MTSNLHQMYRDSNYYDEGVEGHASGNNHEGKREGGEENDDDDVATPHEQAITSSNKTGKIWIIVVGLVVIIVAVGLYYKMSRPATSTSSSDSLENIGSARQSVAEARVEETEGGTPSADLIESSFSAMPQVVPNATANRDSTLISNNGSAAAPLVPPPPIRQHQIPHQIPSVWSAPVASQIWNNPIPYQPTPPISGISFVTPSPPAANPMFLSQPIGYPANMSNSYGPFQARPNFTPQYNEGISSFSTATGSVQSNNLHQPLLGQHPQQQQQQQQQEQEQRLSSLSNRDNSEPTTIASFSPHFPSNKTPATAAIISQADSTSDDPIQKELEAAQIRLVAQHEVIQRQHDDTIELQMANLRLMRTNNELQDMLSDMENDSEDENDQEGNLVTHRHDNDDNGNDNGNSVLPIQSDNKIAKGKKNHKKKPAPLNRQAVTPVVKEKQPAKKRSANNKKHTNKPKRLVPLHKQIPVKQQVSVPVPTPVQTPIPAKQQQQQHGPASTPIIIPQQRIANYVAASPSIRTRTPVISVNNIDDKTINGDDVEDDVENVDDVDENVGDDDDDGISIGSQDDNDDDDDDDDDEEKTEGEEEDEEDEEDEKEEEEEENIDGESEIIEATKQKKKTEVVEEKPQTKYGESKRDPQTENDANKTKSAKSETINIFRSSNANGFSFQGNFEFPLQSKSTSSNAAAATTVAPSTTPATATTPIPSPVIANISSAVRTTPTPSTWTMPATFTWQRPHENNNKENKDVASSSSSSGTVLATTPKARETTTTTTDNLLETISETETNDNIIKKQNAKEGLLSFLSRTPSRSD